MQNNHFYVITGGPGAGKTTLINALRAQKYHCIPEVARKIIREQVQTGGQALPWANTEEYAQLMLDRSISTYKEAERRDHGITFFDRGLPDTLCYVQLINSCITDKMGLAAKKYRYNTRIFLLPPWKKNYQTDKERKQDWEEAVLTYELMADTYRRYDYEVVEVPKYSVAQRVDVILKHLS